MKNNKGFAIVTALGLLMILMIVVGVVSATSVAESKQGKMAIELAQARAIADAGEVYASANIGSPTGRDAIGAVLQPSINPSVNPQAQWSIGPSSWNGLNAQLEQMLNASFNSVSASNLNNLGTANINYQISNFRGIEQNANSQIYTADYVIVSTGLSSSADAKRRVENRGVLTMTLGYNPLNQFLFLVDDAGGQNGFYGTGSVFNGPVHANKNWGFWRNPVFKGRITTSSNCAWYWDLRRNPRKRCLDANSRPPVTVPTFEQGFQRGMPEIDLPTTTVSEAKAALGMDVNIPGQPTATQTCNALLGGPCPPGGLPNGAYLKNNGTSITGGIYIEGDVDELTLDGSGKNGIQVYTIRQGNLRTIITINHNTNTTSLDLNPRPAPIPNVPGSGYPRNYQGTPNGNLNDQENQDGGGQPSGANGQIYVNGRISNLHAPARTGAVNPPAGNAGNHPPSSNIPPALALETSLNITTKGQINLTSDIVYECDPTMLADAAYLASSPRCNIGENNTLPTVLGMTSLQQDVRISNAMPNNPYLWGSYLAGTPGQGLTVQNWGSRPAQGTMRVFGGLLQNADQLRGRVNWNGSLRNGFYENFDFDSRFQDGALAPPNFPRGGAFAFTNAQTSPLSYKEY